MNPQNSEEKTESKFYDGVCSMIVLGIIPKPLRTKPKINNRYSSD